MQVIMTAGIVYTLLCLWIGSASSIKNFDDLRVRTDIFDHEATESFIALPKTTGCTEMKNYVRVEPENDFRFPLDFYCPPEDPRLCLMFDKKGNVAGIQISFLNASVCHIDPRDYDFESNINFIHTDFFGIPAYSARFYFTNPETLTVEGRRDLEEVAEGLWTYLDGCLTRIPRRQPSGLRIGNFYKQGCVRKEGQIYSHNLYLTASCSHQFYMFLLYEEGGLVGFGMAAPGPASRTSNRLWYESPKLPWMTLSVPFAPPCTYYLLAKYGITSMHVFLVKEPWDISCSLPIIGRIL